MQLKNQTDGFARRVALASVFSVGLSSITSATNSSCGGGYCFAGSVHDAETDRAIASVVDVRRTTVSPARGLPPGIGTRQGLPGSPDGCPLGVLVGASNGSDAYLYRWRPSKAQFEKTAHFSQFADYPAQGLTVSGCRVFFSEELGVSETSESGRRWTVTGRRWSLYSKEGQKIWSIESPPVFAWKVFSPGPVERPGEKVLDGNYLVDLNRATFEVLVRKMPSETTRMTVWVTSSGRRVGFVEAGRGRIITSVDGSTWTDVEAVGDLAHTVKEYSRGTLTQLQVLLDPADADKIELWTVPYVSLPAGVTGVEPFVVFRSRDGGLSWDRFVVPRSAFREPPVPGPEGTRVQFGQQNERTGRIFLRIWRTGKPFQEILTISRDKPYLPPPPVEIFGTTRPFD